MRIKRFHQFPGNDRTETVRKTAVTFRTHVSEMQAQNLFLVKSHSVLYRWFYGRKKKSGAMYRTENIEVSEY